MLAVELQNPLQFEKFRVVWVLNESSQFIRQSSIISKLFVKVKYVVTNCVIFADVPVRLLVLKKLENKKMPVDPAFFVYNTESNRIRSEYEKRGKNIYRKRDF